jgi:hypothetical protein
MRAYATACPQVLVHVPHDEEQRWLQRALLAKYLKSLLHLLVGHVGDGLE